MALPAILLAHAAVVGFLVGSGPLLYGEALVQDDYSLHLARAIAARQLLWQSGRLWGYDPSLMAGYPVGTFESVGNRAAEITVALLSPLQPEHGFAVVIALLYLTPPLCMYWATRWFGLSRDAAVAAAGLAALLFYSFIAGSDLKFLAYGMYAHATMLPLAVLVAAAAVRLAARPGWRRGLGTAALLGLGLTLHAAFAIAAFPPLAAAWIATPGGRWLRRTGLFAAATAVAVVTNLHWIQPLFAVRDALDRTNIVEWGAMQPQDLLKPSLTLFHAIVLIGAWGLPGFARTRGRGAAAACASGALTLVAAAEFGSLLPVLRELQPGRFMGGVPFFLMPPAVDAVARWSHGLRRRHVGALGLTLVVGLPAVANATAVLWKGDRILSMTQVPTEVHSLLGSLRETTTPDARIMVEEEDHESGEHRYGHTHLPALFPHLLDREFIGGPYQDSRYVQHFASFGNARAFGRPLRTLSDGELSRYLDLYNVGWIVAWSKEAKSDFAARPAARRIARVGHYEIFGVDAPHSFVMGQKHTRVTATFDRISVSGVAAGETVLKYHWMDGLRTEPPLPLRRIPVLDDPVGFIGVANGSVTDFAVVFEP